MTAAGIVAWATWSIWKRRQAHGGLVLFWVMAAIQVWTLTAAAEAAADSLPVKIFWSKVQYLGAVSAGPLLLVFTLLYTHRRRLLTRRNALLLSIVPILIFLLVLTNEAHHLIWTEFIPQQTLGGILYRYEHGPLFWLHIAYAYLCVAAAAALLIQEYRRSQATYRRQYASFILATLLPLAGSVFYVSGISPLPGLDLSALAMAGTGIFILHGTRAFGLLDLLPIARHTLVEHLEDGVIVIDLRNRIVDVNRAVMNAFGFERPPLGQDVFMTFHQVPLLAATLLQKPRAPMEISLPGQPERHLDVRLTQVLGDRGQTEGYIAVLRDISDRKRIEAALEEKSRQLERMAITDDLTGLFNRRYVDQLIEREFRRSERYHIELSMALFDIDDFKRINDSLGHAHGDDALRAVARAIQAITRSTDIAARVGGDEFMILFPHTSAEDAWKIMERLRTYLGDSALAFGGVALSISGGVMAWKKGVNPADIVRNVDDLLYEAKRLGKNRVVRPDPDL